MNEPRIALSLGDETESLLARVLKDIDDDVLDQLDVDRELAPTEGLTGEPVTIGAVITGSAMVLAAVVRLIERYLEHRQQGNAMRIIAEGFSKHPELGSLLKDLAEKYSQVSISYGIAKEAWGPQSSG